MAAQREAHQGSSNSWLELIMDEPGSSSTAATASQKNPKIQEVQRILREVKTNKNCFDPRVVSFGPLHHGKPKLQVFEKLKYQPAREFFRECGKNFDEFRSEFHNATSYAMYHCYDEALTHRFTYEDFARMMFLDGCFIIQFVRGKIVDFSVIHHALSVVRDLLLLENQIPYKVLTVLMGLNCGFLDGERRIIEFINGINGINGDTSPESYQLRLREGLGQRRGGEDAPMHLLDLLRRQLTDPRSLEESTNSDAFTHGIGRFISREWHSHRSAKDFKTVGITFRASKTGQFTDIGFEATGTSGILTLPKIIIDEKTKSILLNLAAYEADPGKANDLPVTSYICFMDSIIDTARDVKVLRSEGILQNNLGSDQQVADIFNEIATELVPSPHAYWKVKEGIMNHHNSSIKVWVAEGHHTHFRSPWTIIAVIAAIFALTLSVIQTVFGGIQAIAAVRTHQK